MSFDLEIDSKLRGSDSVKIKIGDLVSGVDIRTREIVIQQKTGKPVQFELTADVRASCSLGANVAATRSMTTLFRAESAMPATSARANTLDVDE